MISLDKIRGWLATHKKHYKTTSGIIRVHSRGFGFLVPTLRESFPDDIFIPKRAIQGAVDGDTVEVEIHPHVASDKGPEGRVLKILRRGRSHLMGVIVEVGKLHTYAYAPLLGKDPYIRIEPSSAHKVQVGDRILIQVLDWGSAKRGRSGIVSSCIGHITDPSVDTAAAICEFNIKSTFPSEVIEEATAFPPEVSPEEWKDREDLRSLDCITIDPDGAKDFDDAISLQKDRKGHFLVGVHIADVSHYVTPGSALDQEALYRCNSVYFPGVVVPMLPHELSSHLCSLKPHVDRLAVTVFIHLDNEGTIVDYRICRSVIESKKRFTYKEAKLVLDGRKESPFRPLLLLLVELCYLLKKKRHERGSIEFSIPDISLHLLPNGNVQSVEYIEYDITHQLVEECMLLANAVVATHTGNQDLPMIYRVHDAPSPESIRDFAATAHLFGFPLPSAPTNEELQALFQEAKEMPCAPFLATAFIRSMKLANYSTENIGHYGLGLPHYTHFTSPIRRYVDLLVHRTLLAGAASPTSTDLQEIATQCSDKERLSAKAESSVTSLKKLRYLAAYKAAGHDIYAAIVIAMKPLGILFELPHLLFEGWLPIAAKHLKIGSEIEVQLQSIDLITREAVWSLYTKKTSSPSSLRKPQNRRRKKKTHRH